MAKEIWLLRHGSTTGNEANIIQSRTDHPLSEQGQSHAEQFYNTYGQTEFNGIHISPLIRTRQSVGGFIDPEKNRVPLSILEELNDMQWGSEFMGMDLEHTKFTALRGAWIKGQTHLKA